MLSRSDYSAFRETPKFREFPPAVYSAISVTPQPPPHGTHSRGLYSPLFSPTRHRPGIRKKSAKKSSGSRQKTSDFPP